jgi:tRNA A-37 threonylcarbamoyl transferase component Bud32
LQVWQRIQCENMTQTTQPGSPKAIFIAAREIVDAAERARFLETSCAGDAGLKQRVETLLQASSQTDDFLAETAEVESEVRVAVGDRIGYFGDYVLLDEIARGASGVVFRARQTSLDRVVALKMLRGHGLAEGDDGLRRFKAEAQAAAGLKHANLVPIYEVGEFEGQGYYSMPLIEGGTLISRAAEFREPRRAVALMVKVARAIHAAHEHGLLHRDIKPGNILIDAEGEPQVTDFGIARKMGLDSDLTVTGQIMGTPYYMSPEQARGETQSLTAVADVYGISAVLYELVTGEKPFSGDSMIEVLKKVVEEPPKAPQGIERDLSVIVMKCLEKAPSARYATAAALADDLEKWLRGEPISARPAGRIERLVKWVRRSPYKAAMVALGVVCLLSWAVFAALVSADAFTAPPVVFELDSDQVPIPAGEPLNVIEHIRISGDESKVWSRTGSELVATPLPSSRSPLTLPVSCWGDYNLEMRFRIHADAERLEGGLSPSFLVQVGRNRVQFVLGANTICRCAACVEGGTAEPVVLPTDQAHPYGPVTGFSLLNGKLPAFNSAAVYRHTIQGNTEHLLQFQIRQTGEEASIRVELNNQPLTSWSGPISHVSAASAILKLRKAAFGIMPSREHRITFSGIVLTPIRGKAWRPKKQGKK